MRSRLLFPALLLLCFGVGGPFGFPDNPPGAPTDRLGMHLGAARLESAGALAFGQDNVLFVADSRGAMLWALAVADTGRAQFTGRPLVPDLDRKVAGVLGTTRDQIRFGDMAVHPATGNLFLSVSRESAEGSTPALIRVRGPDRVELVDLDRIRFSKTSLPAAPSRDAKTPWGQPQWSLAITDLAFVDGELWVAGLSNEQFASALRRVPFPFGREGTLTTVEIFHTSHDKWETAAPIEAFLPITLDGTPSLLAGYGCSPVAAFRRDALKDGAHVRGRTVAELGGGNRPLDMIRYRSHGKDWILIANNNRTLMRMDPEEVARAPGLTVAVQQAFQPEGVGYLPVASSGVMHLVNLDRDRIAVLRRDTATGAVEVVGYDKKWL